MAWLAGIIDGEGNLQATIKRAANGKDYFMPKVRIANTDVRMIQKVARIYLDLGVVFFYTINKRKHRHATWRDMLHIEIASQGSARKLLEALMPYLCNKAEQAMAIVDMVKFVQSRPKGGNTTSYDYINTADFGGLMNKYQSELKWHIDPSTTKRKAGTVCSW